MKRKIILGVGVLSLFALASCSSKPASLSELATAEKVKTEVYDARTTHLDETLKTSLDNFAVKTALMCNDLEDNSCVSPLSIYSALSMLSGVTAGKTQKEILDYLDIDYETLAKSYGDLYKASNIYNYDTKEYIEVLNNSMWLQKGREFKNDGVKQASKDFYADMYSIDFAAAGTAKYINNYIKQKTNGLINENVDIPADTVVALINTLYAKDNWLEFGYDLETTDDEMSFVNGEGETVYDNFLIKHEDGKAYKNDMMKTFAANTDNGYSVKFIVPVGKYTIKDVFTADNIKAALTANYFDYDEEKYEYLTKVKFPKFSASSNLDLKENLKAGGIKEAFTENADFSTISDDPLMVDKVSHITNLEVNEKGIKGAAVTAVMAGDACAMDDRIQIVEDFIVDRAFGYIIKNRQGVLFTGIINNI